MVKEVFAATASQGKSSRDLCKATTAKRSAIGLWLLVTSCVTAKAPTQKGQEYAILMNISSGQSLIAASSPPCEGVFEYRGVSYLIEVDGCPPRYKGSATVRGLDWPDAIEGDYMAEPGNVLWRNQNGVVIEPSPLIQSRGNHGDLRISISAAALPRQP